MRELLHYYETFIAFFSISYILFYMMLAFLSYFAIKKHINAKYFTHDDILAKSNHVVGVSVVAPAFNEGQNVVFNVKSLLSLTYPKFEVVIVNDGSTDDTLEKLIQEFEMVKVDFFY